MFEKIYLELNPENIKKPSTNLNGTFEIVENPSYEFYRKWHDDVGRAYGWDTRERINDQENIEALLNQPGVEMSLLKVDKEEVGYGLTEMTPEAEVEISDFGFLPEHINHGYGSFFFPILLEHLINQGAQRIWLSTRSTNHPKVVDFYQKFGFQVYKREEVFEEG